MAGFATLPRDVLFHFLMIQHPADLYQVSHFIPPLRRMAQQPVFRRAYRMSWIPLLLEQTPTPISRLGLAILQRKVDQDDMGALIRLSLDHQDEPTTGWLLGKINGGNSIINKLVSHIHITTSFRHIIFDRFPFELGHYLEEHPEEMGEYIYDHRINYTHVFIALFQQQHYDLADFYLTGGELLILNSDQLLNDCVRRADERGCKICLVRLSFNCMEIHCIIKKFQPNHDLLSLLVDHLPPWSITLTVSRVADTEYYREYYHDFALKEMDNTLKVIGVFTSNEIVPLSALQKRIAENMKLSLV